MITQHGLHRLERGESQIVTDDCGETIIAHLYREQELRIDGSDTVFLAVLETSSAGMVITSLGRRTVLHPGEVAAIPGPATIRHIDGVAAIRKGWHGLQTIAWPVEEKGRLKYIDGCTDTLLISPPRVGDPCMNHVHCPGGVMQTMHTHLSVRAGCVLRGGGECVTPTGRVALRQGMVWFLPAGAEHCFGTAHGLAMDVVVYQPDSATGPCDDSHPALNGTMVDHVAANELPGIWTR